MSTIAERYARAVFELGVESGQLPQVTAQFVKLADAYAASEELRGVVDNPLTDDAKRVAILSALGARLGLAKVALNTARLLMQRHRMCLLPDIARALSALADAKAGVLRATVTSAAPLSESYCQKLVRELEQMTRRTVVLDRKTDPSLIAGVVTRIGDNTIDGSIKGRLEALERQLLSR